MPSDESTAWMKHMDLCQLHTPKEGCYTVNFFLLFLNKSQKDPIFGFYNFVLYNVTSARETQGCLFLKRFSGEAA